MAGYAEPLGDVWKYDPDYNRAADFLGIDKHQREDIKIAQKISFVIDWAQKSKKSTKLEDNLWTLNDLRKKLGVNSQGEPLLGQLFEFLRLKQDRERKMPEVPYEQIINEMISAKREENKEKQVKDFKKQNRHIEIQIENGQKRANKIAEKTIEQYRSSFKPEPKEKITVQKSVDHTPIVQPL